MDLEEFVPYFLPQGSGSILLRGARSWACVNLRRALRHLGFDEGLPREGDAYDERLSGAVRSFQKARDHANKDGKFGIGTCRLLVDALLSRSSSPATLLRRLGIRDPQTFVFVSYKREDRAVLEPVLAALSEWGYPSWSDTSIPGGADWTRSIHEHAARARLALVLLTPAALASHWVFHEVMTCVGHGKPILPILVGGTVLQGVLAAPLAGTQYLECVSGGLPDALESALDELWHGARS